MIYDFQTYGVIILKRNFKKNESDLYFDELHRRPWIINFWVFYKFFNFLPSFIFIPNNEIFFRTTYFSFLIGKTKIEGFLELAKNTFFEQFVHLYEYDFSKGYAFTTT